MNKISFKSILSLILIMMVSLLFVGCKKVEYQLELSFDETIKMEEVTTVSFSVVTISQKYDVTGIDLELKSMDPTIATVNGNEIVGVSAGTVDIVGKVIFDGQELTMVKKLTVEPILKLFRPEKLQQGDYLQMELKWLPSGEVVNIVPTIESADSQIVWVKEEGALGFSLGTTTINATFKNKDINYVEEFNIEVVDTLVELEKINITGANVVALGKYMQLTANAFPTGATADVEWSTSDEKIAVVDTEGKVSGVAEGEVEIIASSLDVKSSIKIKVVAADKVSTSYGANYYIDEYLEYNELPFGIIQSTSSSYSSTEQGTGDADGYSGITRPLEKNSYYHQQVNVLEIPSDENIKIVPWANFGGHQWNLTTVKGLINDYESQHPEWKVIAAINGDFFDINAEGAYGSMPYQTKGPLTVEGENYRTHPEQTLGFKNDGSTNPLIGHQEVKRSDVLKLSIYDENNLVIAEYDVQKVNQEPGSNETSVFFGYYVKTEEGQEFTEKKVSISENLYVVEKADLALPCRENDFYGKGTISKIVQEEITLGTGSFAIATTNEELKLALQNSPKIRVQYEIIGAYADASSLAGCQSTIVYENTFIQDMNDFTGTRAPRTVVGVKADGTIVMMVIDGRQGSAVNEEGMYGADFTELSAIMKYYDCISYYNLDGGGSSTMVIRDESGLRVLNSPSDMRERSDGNCILIVTKEPSFTATVTHVEETSVNLNVTTNSSTIKKIFVEVNDKFYEVNYGQVKIDNLVHGNKYYYNIYYENANGEMVKTLHYGSFSTEKKMFKVLGVIYEELDDAFIIKIRGTDIDNISTMESASVYLNGTETFALMKGDYQIRLPKSKISELTQVTIKFFFKGEEIEGEFVQTYSKEDCLYIDNRTIK